MKKIEIGYITKPQGLKGEVRIKLHSNDFSILNNVESIYVDKEEFKLISKTNRNTFAIIRLENITDINEAEKLRNLKIYVNYDDINLEEDEMLVSELIGYELITNSNIVLGKVKDIANYGAGDVYTIATPDGKEFLFVNANDVILEVDNNKKIIIVDEIKLKELSV